MIDAHSRQMDVFRGKSDQREQKINILPDSSDVEYRMELRTDNIESQLQIPNSQFPSIFDIPCSLFDIPPGFSRNHILSVHPAGCLYAVVAEYPLVRLCVRRHKHNALLARERFSFSFRNNLLKTAACRNRWI